MFLGYQHMFLGFWPRNICMFPVVPLPLLEYKRPPRHPLPRHNKFQAFLSSFPLHGVHKTLSTLPASSVLPLSPNS
jgi:hypothetical protein